MSPGNFLPLPVSPRTFLNAVRERENNFSQRRRRRRRKIPSDSLNFLIFFYRTSGKTETRSVTRPIRPRQAPLFPYREICQTPHRRWAPLPPRLLRLQHHQLLRLLRITWIIARRWSQWRSRARKKANNEQRGKKIEKREKAFSSSWSLAVCGTTKAALLYNSNSKKKKTTKTKKKNDTEK